MVNINPTFVYICILRCWYLPTIHFLRELSPWSTYSLHSIIHQSSLSVFVVHFSPQLEQNLIRIEYWPTRQMSECMLTILIEFENLK